MIWNGNEQANRTWPILHRRWVQALYSMKQGRIDHLARKGAHLINGTYSVGGIQKQGPPGRPGDLDSGGLFTPSAHLVAHQATYVVVSKETMALRYSIRYESSRP